jgi:hypothetical protein
MGTLGHPRRARSTSASRWSARCPRWTPPRGATSSRRIGEHVARHVPDGATHPGGHRQGAQRRARGSSTSTKRARRAHRDVQRRAASKLVKPGRRHGRHKTRFENAAWSPRFATGTRRCTTSCIGNPFVEFHPSDVVNDPNEIRKQHHMIAINSALEIDLTGQVCADSVGERIHSGIGGQMDFVQRRRAAAPAGGPSSRCPPPPARGTASSLAHRAAAAPGRRRGDHARPRAVGGHRARRGEPARPHAPRARRAAHLDLGPRVPRRAPGSRFGAEDWVSLG